MKSPREHALGLLEKAEHDLVQLSPYAVEIRYDDTIAPDLDEARGALAAAREVHQLACGLLSPTRPQGQ